MDLHDFGDGKGLVQAHRHRNGGGWVAATAKVAETARVGQNATVFGNACVTDQARIRGRARVFGNATIAEHAVVRGQAQVCGNARVLGRVHVHGEARVAGDIILSGIEDVRAGDVGFDSTMGFELHAVTIQEKAAWAANITYLNDRLPFGLPDAWI